MNSGKPLSRHRAQAPADLRPVMAAWGRQQAAMSAETARFFIDLDLTMAQLRALGQIRRWGRMTGRDLAGRLGVTPGTVVPLIDRLEGQGYLRRVTDAQDRRLTWLEVTPTGEELFRRMFSASGEKVMEAIRQLTPTDRKTFGRLLNQIADYLESRGERAREKEPSIDSRRRGGTR